MFLKKLKSIERRANAYVAVSADELRYEVASSGCRCAVFVVHSCGIRPLLPRQYANIAMIASG